MTKSPHAPVPEHAALLVAELRGDIDLATATHLRLRLDHLVAVAAPAYRPAV